MTPYPIAWLPPVSKWGPSYRLATQEQWAPRRGNGSSKGQAILWRWREGWRDGSQGGETRRWGVMGMVWGHIFNHVTKREAAWETRLCFSNPAGRFCSTLLRSLALKLTLTTWKKKKKQLKKSYGCCRATTSQPNLLSMQKITMWLDLHVAATFIFVFSFLCTESVTIRQFSH